MPWWSCMRAPTLGLSRMTGMPNDCSSAPGPMPIAPLMKDVVARASTRPSTVSGALIVSDDRTRVSWANSCPGPFTVMPVAPSRSVMLRMTRGSQ